MVKPWSYSKSRIRRIIQAERDKKRNGEVMLEGVEVLEISDSELADFEDSQSDEQGDDFNFNSVNQLMLVRRELFEIRDLLSAAH